MKKQIKSLLIIALLAGMSTPVWGQASTEGKEFWVALLMANSPSGFSGSSFDPFIAISAKKQCQVTVSNPAQGWTRAPQTVSADSWTIINDIPNDKWYDEGWQASNASEKLSKLGIKVEATEEVSVYAAIRMEFSYDATNILPASALGSEYLIQDYPAYNKEGEAHSIIMVLATEDNTEVEIMPSIKTVNGTDTRIRVTLNKGETYQVISQDQLSFSGTRVRAYSTIDRSDPKPIAVFSGADFTQVPGGQSARDCLYEQAMPTDYWGTEFVVTRSQEKDANRIRITALDNTTDVFIDGNPRPAKTLQPAETWEFEMSENLASTDMASKIASAGREVPAILTGDAHYIKTSCPVAVFNYDVSSGYVHSSTSDKIGDPSMVWISPLQQRIGKITFGACGTPKQDEGHTNRHFVNIVCKTSDVSTVKLSSDKRANIPTSFTPVPGNPDYSYARLFLVDTDESNADKVYTLSASDGVVAHVYGSGKNESYAYSVGSAAVKRGIAVNGKVFTDGYVGDTKICTGSTVEFNAQVGNDDIERVDWDFGDGTSMINGPAIVSHTYTAATWYDVKATLYGHQVCTNEADQELGTISFSFRISRPDTIYRNQIDCSDDTHPRPSSETVTTTYDCDSIVVLTTHYPTIPSYEYSVTGYDSYVLNGITYTDDYDTTWTMARGDRLCDSTITCHIKIIKCLNLQLDLSSGQAIDEQGNGSANDLSICLDDQYYRLPVSYDVHGQHGKAWMVINGEKTVAVTVENDTTIDGERVRDTLRLPTKDLTPGHYRLRVEMEDLNCDTAKLPALNFTVRYPQNVFAMKFNNVLAVYRKGQGGNRYSDFQQFQWYRNGGKLTGANQSTYHTEKPFIPGDIYYVELTDENNLTLPTCEFIVPEEIDDYTPQEQEPAAAKKLINNHIYIVIDKQMYDAYGTRIK